MYMFGFHDFSKVICFTNIQLLHTNAIVFRISNLALSPPRLFSKISSLVRISNRKLQSPCSVFLVLEHIRKPSRYICCYFVHYLLLCSHKQWVTNFMSVFHIVLTNTVIFLFRSVCFLEFIYRYIYIYMWNPRLSCMQSASYRGRDKGRMLRDQAAFLPMTSCYEHVILAPRHDWHFVYSRSILFTMFASWALRSPLLDKRRILRALAFL